MARLLCILGPTAVGKTDLAIRVALRVGGEIISIDSRQIYRHMDIGTAKPTAKQLQLVAHHMIDCATPDETFSAARFQRAADKAIKQIQGRKKIPMLVGGSGMYFRAVVDGLFDGPEADPSLRQRLKQEANTSGISWLYDRLKDVDPEAARKIHPNDLVRIIRALEVYELSGKPISQLQKQWESGKSRYEIIAFGLTRPREDLYQRIEARVDQMMDEGLLDEARSLLEYDRNLRSMNCFGYKELFSFLEGRISLDEAIRLIKQNTRRYAKRQLTWFKKDKRIRWLDLSQCISAEETIVREWQLHLPHEGS